MKFLKSFVIILLLVVSLSFCGCKDKNLSQPILERDIYNTGGNLSFYYDEVAHVATFGGEGEVIQYYNEDIVKGWVKEGNRIGFQVPVPKEVRDYKSGSAVLDGEKLLSNDYISIQEGQNLIAIFQPIVKKDKINYTLKITWEDGKNEQLYFIVIAPGTIFMEKTIN